MATTDIWSADAFTMASLTGLVQDMDYNPQMLGNMNLFTPEPVRTQKIGIDKETDTLSLIGLSERGSPSNQNTRYSRNTRDFVIPRLAIEDTVYAAEIANLRASGSETELMSVQTEVNNRLMRMRQKVEYTKEYLRLAAIQGLALDPSDGSTYYSYYTEFGVTQDTATSFELDVTTTDVAGIARGLVRSIMRSAKGAWIMGQSRVVALVGDDFYDALINHPQVRETYVNWAAASDLRNVSAFSEFTYGDITWVNYRGSDDNSEIAIAADEAKFFVEGGDGIFAEALAPADEFSPYVNTLGQSVYAVQEIDAAFPSTPRFAKYHVMSYPLFICKRPNTLRRGTLT